MEVGVDPRGLLTSKMTSPLHPWVIAAVGVPVILIPVSGRLVEEKGAEADAIHQLVVQSVVRRSAIWMRLAC